MNTVQLYNQMKAADGFDVGERSVHFTPSRTKTSGIDTKARTVVSTISTETKDRHGDVMVASGVQLDSYKKNPVVLWCHDYKIPPIAKAIDIMVNESEIISKAEFQTDTELAREIWGLIEKGFLNAWSIGFIPKKYKYVEKKDEEGGDDEYFKITKWDLMEYSSVPVPSNFESLTHALKSAQITAPAIIKAFGHLGLEAPDLVSVPTITKEAQAKESGKKKEEDVMTLAELLEKDANAKAAHDSAITKARESGLEQGRTELKSVIDEIMPIIKSGVYGEKVTEVAASVLKGESSLASFKATIASIDAIMEAQKSVDAGKDTEETPDVAPEQTDVEVPKKNKAASTPEEVDALDKEGA